MSSYEFPMHRAIDTLRMHGIDHKVENGNLFALEVYTIRFGDHVQTKSQWVDVSDFTHAQLMAWLGY